MSWLTWLFSIVGGLVVLMVIIKISTKERDTGLLSQANSSIKKLGACCKRFFGKGA